MTNDVRDRLIADALVYAGGTHTVADVVAECDSGRWQLWGGRESIVVTMLSEHPQCKEAFAFLAAGNLEEIQRLYPLIETWAKAMGCRKASFRGRKGWARTFLTKAEGWREAATIFEKEL